MHIDGYLVQQPVTKRTVKRETTVETKEMAKYNLSNSDSKLKCSQGVCSAFRDSPNHQVLNI